MIRQLELESKWRHTSGNEYVIKAFTNMNSTNLIKYPPTVVYQGNNDLLWSRPINDWHRSFIPVEYLPRI